VPDTWTATAASGRSIEKLPTFEITRVCSSPERNASNSRSRSLFVVDPCTIGASKYSPNWCS